MASFGRIASHAVDLSHVNSEEWAPLCSGLASVVGESAIYDQGAHVLFWVDIEGRRMYRYNWGDAECIEFATEERIGSIGLHEPGVLFAGAETGFGRLRPEEGVVSRRIGSHYQQDDKRLVRLNDGKADRQGRFVCGIFNSEHCETPQWEPRDGVFRAGPTPFAPRLLDVGVCGANGTCFSPAGDVMYFTDSPQRKLLRFAYGPDQESLRMTEAQVVADLDALGIVEDGVFDGACVDADGNIWACICFGGCVLHLDAATGAVLRRIEMPVKRPTCPVLAGPDLDILVITSIGPPIVGAEELAACPRSGEIFGMRVATPGLPEPTVVIAER